MSLAISSVASLATWCLGAAVNACLGRAVRFDLGRESERIRAREHDRVCADACLVSTNSLSCGQVCVSSVRGAPTFPHG
eukprot:6199370-Pleurochrysis_carterae.AAC.1